MYAATTPPAIVAKPPVMTACISDLVIYGNIGLITNGASAYKNYTVNHISQKVT